MYMPLKQSHFSVKFFLFSFKGIAGIIEKELNWKTFEFDSLIFFSYSLLILVITCNIWNGHSLQVLITPTHLAIVMEYAAGGELFERICSAGRFSEDEVA